MRVRRFDVGELSKPVREANGWMRVDAFLARTGVQAYRKQDGSTRLEYRPPDEVFNADSLKSFEAVPFTNDHPPEPLDATNTKKYQVGHLVGAPVQDGDKMRASILVTDAATVAELEGGKREISNGYFCELEESPGVAPDGQRYDCVQRGITGNHVALVDQGRAGSSVRIRMDAADAAMLPSTHKPIRSESAGVKTMKTVRFDVVDVEIADAMAPVVEKHLASLAARADAAKADADKAAAKADAETARADALKTELEATKAKLAAAPEQARAAITARSTLEQNARKVCGAETKVDGVDDKDLRKLIAATAAGPEVKLDEKSDAYLDALCDLAVQRADEAGAVADVVASTTEVGASTHTPKNIMDVAADIFRRASAAAAAPASK